MSAAGPAAQTARDIIEASRYLVLATADAAGRPWSSPVYFAHIGFTEFYWVSSPGVTHSRNIAVRPEVGIAVFDSHAEIGTGQGVVHVRRRDPGRRRRDRPGDRGVLPPFGGSRRPGMDERDVRPGGGIRLYRATADSLWILAKDGQPDHRIPVPLS